MDRYEAFRVLDETARDEAAVILPPRTTLASQPAAREPLSSIPVRPLNTRRKSRPICDPSNKINASSKDDLLTPPHTPVRANTAQFSKCSSDLSESKNALARSFADKARLVDEVQIAFAEHRGERTTVQNVSWSTTTPLALTQDYEFIPSVRDKFVEYGRGAWSVVYAAQACRASSLKADGSPCSETKSRHGLPTPQSTPRHSLSGAKSPQLFAAKVPSHRGAREVIRKEARVLTWLRIRSADYTNYVVEFHGYNAEEHLILLSAITLDLEHFALSAAKNARSSASSSQAFDPVVGLREWEELAMRLVDGLVFLQDARCVHGDIKPKNILLKPTGTAIDQPNSPNGLRFTPVFIDFSSSRICPEDSSSERLSKDDEVSAVTPTFTDPALLLAHRSKEPVFATYANDVYALGVTLLFAAIGECPYSCASLPLQKQIMAKEGRPLDFARSGHMATRVSKGGRVDRCLAQSFEKGDARWDVKAWKDNLEITFATLG